MNNIRVSKNDVREVVITTLLGTLLFGAASIGSLLTRKKIAQPEFLVDVKTQFVQKDKQLCAWLAEVERDIKSSQVKITFLRLVHEMERMIGSYEEFVTKRRERTLTPNKAIEYKDVIVALIEQIRLKSIPTFLTQFEMVEKTADTRASVQDAMKHVDTYLKDYAINITTLAA